MSGRASTRVITAGPLTMGHLVFRHKSSVLENISTPKKEIDISTVPAVIKSRPEGNIHVHALNKSIGAF